MNSDEVMRAVGEARDAADAGAAEYLRLTEENERLRAENEGLQFLYDVEARKVQFLRRSLVEMKREAVNG